MAVSISTIKNWFRRGLRPTESQFSNTWDSFWHKDEQIPATSVENLQEKFDEKLDVETYELEKDNFQNTSFKNVDTGTPNTDTTQSAYREGKIGIGEPSPEETVDVIGSAKFQYTYSDGSIARSTLGGENTNSEIGLPSGLIKTNTSAFYPDPSIHPGMQGYFYTGDISVLNDTVGKLSTGLGVADFGNTKGATITMFPQSENGNPNEEFALTMQAFHTDGNLANIQLLNKGNDNSNSSEALLVSRVSNGTQNLGIRISPHTYTKGGLQRFSLYRESNFVEGYTHTDGVVIGKLTPLGVDPNGYVGKMSSSSGGGTGLEAIDEGNGVGYRIIGRNSDNFGNIGLDAVDLSLSTTSSTTNGATGRWSFSTGQNNTADGLWSYAGGVNSSASGAESIAYGADVNVTGAGSAGFGRLNTGNGQYIFVAGLSNTVTDNFGNSLGNNNTVSDQWGTAIGSSNIVSSQWGTAIGRNLFSRSGYEYSIGSYGTDYVANNSADYDPEDRLFNVSNGIDESQRSDAFTIYKNGAVQLHPITQASITNATVGMMIMDSGDSNKLKFYDGTAWKTITTN